MYSQYQQYQNYGGGGGNAGATVHQPGMTWNGSAWVPTQQAPAPAVGYSQYSTPTTSITQQASTMIPLNPVHAYTEYYHEYTRRTEQQTALHNDARQSQAVRNTAQQQAAWNKYHADQSSRAAHHFHAHSNATGAPFDLPPAPSTPGQQPQSQPQYQQQQQHNAPVQQYQQQQQQQAPVQQYSNQSQNQPAPAVAQPQSQQQQQVQTPGGFLRYVDRCLVQCPRPDDKAAMMKRVDVAMAQAMKEGRFHSMNWDTLPLLQVATTTAAAAAVATASVAPVSAPNNNCSYYGRSPVATPAPSTLNASTNDSRYGASSGPASNASGSYYGSANASASYYGPASGSGAATSPYGSGSKASKQKSHQSLLSNDSYYGPVATAESSSPSFSHQSFSQQPDSPKKSSKKRKKAGAIVQQRKHSGFDESMQSMGNRAKRFSGPGGLADASTTRNAASEFGRYMGKEIIGGAGKVLTEADYEDMTTKGTCLVLDKSYLRLTAPPRPELVRPQAILEQHLSNIKAERERSDRRDYVWFCSQLKALRQDCRVQRILNAFCVDVYETHARMALQEGDLNEYNQCQTQLKELYELLRDDEQVAKNYNEFVAYRLVYYVFLTCNKNQGGVSDLFQLLLSLTASQKSDPAIQHALQVRVAVADWDYHLFFTLCKDCPHLGVHLMNRIVPYMRQMGLRRMCRAYRPALETEFLLRELGLTNDEFGREWLESCGCVISEDGSQVETKDSVIHESDLEDKKSLI